MSTLKPAEDCAPLGFHSSVGEQSALTNTVSPEVCYRPTACDVTPGKVRWADI